MLMYKEGITREVSEFDVQKFKEMGWVEVKEREDEEERKPKRKRED